MRVVRAASLMAGIAIAVTLGFGATAQASTVESAQAGDTPVVETQSAFPFFPWWP
ncbi:hypothetical protein [Amycolatopsis antarctica]|uniref:hypothetical protein n=1 Tax=Amycolatopsis antarctica TaxID=1854586 RepID=UPI0013FD14B9|nr:hypothetical protein [Amycolatopsis antarctica]